MLDAPQILLLNRVVTTLLKHKETGLASEVSEALTDAAQQRVRIADAAKARGSAGHKGPPRLAYAIALEPGWTQTVHGAKAAAKLVKETLTDLGVPQLAPKQNSMGVALSRNGQWFVLVETDNGTASLTVKRAE